MYNLIMAGIIIGTAKTKKAAEKAVIKLNKLFIAPTVIVKIA